MVPLRATASHDPTLKSMCGSAAASGSTFGARKRIEKLRYMHRNPVNRGLVLEPDRSTTNVVGSHLRKVHAKGIQVSAAAVDLDEQGAIRGESPKSAALGA